MARTGRYHGGLVFLDKQGLTVESFCDGTVAVLNACGHYVEHKTVTDANKARIISTKYAVSVRRIGASADGASYETKRGNGWVSVRGQRQRLEVALIAADADGHDSNEAQMILRAILLDMIKTDAPDRVEYLRPEIVFDTETFLSAFDGSAGRRLGGAAHAFLSDTQPREHDAATDRLMLQAQNPFADANVTGRNRNRFMQMAARGRIAALRPVPLKTRLQRKARRVWRTLSRPSHLASTLRGLVFSRKARAARLAQGHTA